MSETRPALRGIEIGADPEAWTALGFAIDRGRFRAGDVEVSIDTTGPRGMRAWSLSGQPGPMPGFSIPEDDASVAEHRNAVTGVDHVVIATGSIDQVTAELEASGCELRGERHGQIAGNEVTQRFLPLTGALIELVTMPGIPDDAPPAFWGVTFVCDDLSQLPPDLGEPRAAVQPGRQIVPVPSDLDTGTRVAFMTPRQRRSA